MNFNLIVCFFSLTKTNGYPNCSTSIDNFLNPPCKSGCAWDSNKMVEGSGHVESADSPYWKPSNFPALRIDMPNGSDQLLIRIITLKHSTALTSELFEILENESLEVLRCDISSTKEKNLHSIFQVKVIRSSSHSNIISFSFFFQSKSILHNLVNHFRISVIGKMFYVFFVVNKVICYVNALFLVIMFFNIYF